MSLFHVIFSLSNGDTPCPRGCCIDERWDSEFEFDQNLTQAEAVAKAAEAYMHRKFECSYGELHVIPVSTSPEALALCESIKEQGKIDAKENLRLAEERRKAAEQAAKETAKLEKAERQKTNELATLARLQEKYPEGAP